MTRHVKRENDDAIERKEPELLLPSLRWLRSIILLLYLRPPRTSLTALTTVFTQYKDSLPAETKAATGMKAAAMKAAAAAMPMRSKNV